MKIQVIDKVLKNVFRNIEDRVSFWKKAINHGLPKKKLSRKESQKKVAFNTLKTDLLPRETRRRWFIVRGATILMAVVFLAALILGNIVFFKRMEILPLVERREFLSSECERLKREVARAKNHISSGGVHVLGKLPKPRAFLPPPWNIPIIIDSLAAQAKDANIRVESLEYLAHASMLAQVSLEVWWPYSPRDLNDPLSEFINMISREPFINKIVVLNEKRAVGTARASLIIWVSPTERDFQLQGSEKVEGERSNPYVYAEGHPVS